MIREFGLHIFKSDGNDLRQLNDNLLKENIQMVIVGIICADTNIIEYN